MDNITIDGLAIEIFTESKNAVDGVEALAQSLGTLKTATKGGLGLSAVTKQIKSVSDAANGVTSDSINRLTGLANAIQLLSGVKISSTIGKQITSISGSLNGLNINGDVKEKINDLVSTLQPLTQMGKSGLSSFLTPLKKLPDTITALNSVDMTAFKTKILEVTDAVKPLATEMEKVAAGFSAFPAKMQKLITNTNKLAVSNNTAAYSYTNLYHRLKMMVTGVKGVVKSIASAITRTNNYIENVNLFTVSMGSYADEAKQYAEAVSDIMGIDPGEWMRHQGIFMTLATGFGVASDRAYIMSKNLTQLGYDISSFFNLSYAEAMQKLESGLAGELEPLRRIGYDLSQARLEAIALSLGIDKAISSMTQAEKAQLRYYAIMTQVTTAQGDMARTLNAPANQLKVLKAQANMAAQSIGSIFIPALNAILPYAIAVLKVIRLLASSIANLFGFEMPEVDYSGIESVGGVGEDVADSLESATESAKKLKSYMMGFDELNVIDPNSGSGGADDALGGLDFELPEYNFLEGLAESRVGQIVKEMKEWLGLTEEIDSWAKLLDTRFGNILKTVGIIGGSILLWKVSTGFWAAIKTIKALVATEYYGITIGVIVTLAGFTISIEGMKDAVRNSLDGFNFTEIVGGALLGAGGAALLGAKIATWIDTAFASSKVAVAITQAGINIGANTAGAVGGAFGAAISGIILGIPTYFVGIYDAIKNGIDWLNGVLIPLGATAAGAGIGAIIGMLGGPIGAGIGALIGAAVGLVTDLVILIVQKWDEISEFFKKIGGWFYDNVIKPVAGFFVDLWEDIKAVWNTAAQWFDDKVVQPIVNFFRPIGEWISTFFNGCWIIIQAVWVVASTWFNETVIQPIVGFFQGLWEDVSGFFTKLWSDIKRIWNTVANWFDAKVINPIINFFAPIVTIISGFFTGVWNKIVSVWGSVSKWFINTVISPVKNAFNTACNSISGFFTNLWAGIKTGVVSAMNAVIGVIEDAINWMIGGVNSVVGGFNKVVRWAADVIGADWGGLTLIQEVSLKRIPQFEEGGFPASGQAFIARENGIPEMVGTIGRRTAVANNEQIVESVASGVAEANSEQNMLLREQNTLLRALLDKDSGVYLDGRYLSESVDKHKREQGRVLIAGGAL